MKPECTRLGEFKVSSTVNDESGLFHLPKPPASLVRFIAKNHIKIILYDTRVVKAPI